jgi:hypothetical protein
MKSRDIAIVGILLAVGAILRYFLAMLHTPMTPNMVIAFYCLAIILVQPKVYEALGIGIVAGVLSMLITSSLFPPANLISEPLGALVCFGVYAVIKNKSVVSPSIATFLATCVSGFTFAAILIIAITQGLVKTGNTMNGLILLFIPIILVTAIFNAVIVQLLYIPSSRVLMRGQE